MFVRRTENFEKIWNIIDFRSVFTRPVDDTFRIMHRQ